MRFLALHFPVVEFVIVPGEMKHGMQSENPYFLGRCVSKLTCVTGCNVRRNGDIPSKCLHQPRYCGKRQHIRWCIFSPETTIQFPELSAAGHQYTDRPSQCGHPSRAGHKPCQRYLTQPSYFLLNDDQTFSVGKLIQINRRAINRGPPSQSRSLYSFASASAGIAVCFCRGALSTPLVLPFTLAFGSSSDICCSASLVLCSS